MADSSFPIIQINLLYSKSALAILTGSMAVVQTCITIIPEPWLVKGVIRGLGNCSKVFKASITNKVRVCIITKDTDATPLPQLSRGG